jgi:outer membrane protein OmpA-like peptidoglycan-associated protein
VVTVGDDLAADACVFDGEVYASGSRIPVECNSCRCEGGSVSVCTLLACDVGVFEQVYFTEGTQMEPAQERFLASLGSQLAEVPSLMLVAVGHTAQGEQGSLGLERAQVVARAFREAGAPVLGVRGEQAREDTRPAEQQRRVSFEASQLLFDYGSPQVTPRLAERLSRLVPLLKESQEAVVVRGFASAREGDASSQRWLGQARAGAVRDFLVSQGVPAERFAGVEAGDLQEEGEPARSYLKRYVVLTSR